MTTRRPIRCPATFLSPLFVAALLLGPSLVGATLAQPPDPAFSHARWSALLAKYVTEEGWVAYERIRDGASDELDAYLEALARANLAAMSDDEQKAFWINAYNALCIRTLLDEGLPDSVPRRSFLGIGTNIFTLENHEIAGVVRSLDDIEHDILRRNFRDPRVHAALVCGASSCPRLRPEAYEGSRVDRQLDEEVRRWINVERDKNGNRKNRLDRERKTFHASKIFDWFEEDFGGDDEGILAFIERYADPPVREFLENNRVRLRFLDYDWSLNRQDPAPKSR
jgi:hypothetical protein